MFKVTAEWIKANSSNKGGWRADQLALIGVNWPPTKGWVKASVGKQITEQEKRAFEVFADKFNGLIDQSPVVANKRTPSKREKRRRLRALRRKFKVKREKKQNMTWREYSDVFFSSDAWKKLRYKALQICGGKCQCCGRSAIDGAVLHVDHIKPRWTHKHLELDLTNLQVLCDYCNIGKGAIDSTDWRTDEQRAQLQHMKNL